MKNKIIVIHHSADFDGLFCREIARKFLAGAAASGHEVEFIGWDYGQPKLKFPRGQTVYVLDLSPECFETAGIVFEDLIWIDHHKSAIEKWPSSIPGYRIDGVSACRLAWQWFALMQHNAQHATNEQMQIVLPSKEQFINREVPEPYAVQLAGEYDIWDKRNPDAELFQHGLRGAQRDFQWLLSVDPSTNAEKYVVEILEQGRAIRYAKTQENADIILAYGFTVKWEGLIFLCCNHAKFNSFLFTAAIRPEHEGLLGFKWTGSNWSISLYGVPGKPDVDLSAIALKYGGGGHKQACGFLLENIGQILHGTI